MLSEEVGSTRKSVGGGIWWIYAWNRLSHVGQHDMPLIPSSRTAQGSSLILLFLTGLSKSSSLLLKHDRCCSSASLLSQEMHSMRSLSPCC